MDDALDNITLLNYRNDKTSRIQELGVQSLLHENVQAERHLDEEKPQRRTEEEGAEDAGEGEANRVRGAQGGQAGLGGEGEELAEGAGPAQVPLLVKQGEVDKATKRTETENGVLLEFIRKQHLVHAAMQAALTGHAPVQSVICLGTDQVERYNTLMTLKERQLANAERYLAARSRGLSPRSMYCQEECFDSAEGDYYVVRFETVPVWGAHSKEVFDAMLGSVLNQEIILSEMFGCVAIREDNDFETSEFTQLRLVSATSAETKSSRIHCCFRDMTEKAATELWPQTSWILTLCIRIGPTNASGETEPPCHGSLYFFKRYKIAEVAVTRWTCLKIHQSLSRDAETEMKESSVCWGIPVKDLLSNSSFMGDSSVFPKSGPSTEPLLGTAASWLELLSQNTVESSDMESSSEDSRRSERAPAKRSKRTSQKKKRPAKKRRTTYDIRKQQKLLKHRVLIEQGEANTTIERIEVANSVLHEKTQHQHVTIAGMQSMLVSHMQQSLSDLQPAQIVIRLGTDRAERRSTLMAMKDQKLREAKRFMTTWGQGLDTSSTFSQESQFEPLDGGFSAIRVDNAPIRDTTVRAVFDAIIQSMQNAEIMISELFGSITIREDTDFEAADISQIRLVSSTKHGAVVESNSVIFSEYVEEPDGCYGIIAADFVDDDKLYPYRPEERIRRDTITAVLIRLASSDGKADQQDLVVGTRWTCLRLAHTQLDIPKDGLKELQEVSMAWGDTIKKCIMERIAKSNV
ncbi:hypothetical protein GQ600_147 [Phytophthora cactorum]|nr:hypothetical protein GQ600_147 [Phytophthora cactorum]